MENFSDNEISFELNREMLENRRQQKALRKAKFLKEQIRELKFFSVMGMKSIIDTIKSIDDNSKKIVFKHFDQKNVNIFHTQSPDIIKKLTKIAQEASNVNHVHNEVNSDDMISLDSGNMSENDEINKIEKLQNRKLKLKLGRIHSMSDNHIEE